MDETILKGVNLNSATFRRAKLFAVFIKDSVLQKADFQNAEIFNGGFENTLLRRANFDNAVLGGTETFQFCDASGATFRNATLRKPFFWKVDLTEADFTNASVFDGLNRPWSLLELLKYPYWAKLCRTKMPDGSISNRDCPEQ